MPEKNPVELPVAWELSAASDDAVTLKFTGELDAESTPGAWTKLEGELAGVKIMRLTADVSRLSSCDSAGLALLYQLSAGAMTPGARVELVGLDPELQHLFRSFSTEDLRALQEHEPSRSHIIEDVGRASAWWVRDLREQVEFVGEMALALLKGFANPRRMRWREVMRLFEIAGVNALPIVALMTFLVGTVIAFESAQPLTKLGAKVYVTHLLALVMSRELGPVMAAIMLAGRSGSSFAAELGTMKVDEELNALETMGLSPVQFLVVQRVMAGIMLTPILTVYAMCAGLLGGIPVLLGMGFPLRMILGQFQATLRFGDVAEGLAKGLVFGGIVASVSCLRGLQTGEGPRAVGEATTRSVVSSILLIIMADAVCAMVSYTLRK
ncbi:MAG: ABC transporter permease [Terracidiphilus sp.]